MPCPVLSLLRAWVSFLVELLKSHKPCGSAKKPPKNTHTHIYICFPRVSVVKNLPAMQETQVWSLVQADPLEKEKVSVSCSVMSDSVTPRTIACQASLSMEFSREVNGSPFQYSCLGNPMDRGAWQATVHGVTRVGHDLITKQQQIYICTRKKETNWWFLQKRLLHRIFKSIYWKICCIYKTKCSSVTGSKIKIQKSIIVLYAKNNQLEIKQKKLQFSNYTNSNKNYKLPQKKIVKDMRTLGRKW